jgi:hypothetical protein
VRQPQSQPCIYSEPCNDVGMVNRPERPGRVRTPATVIPITRTDDCDLKKSGFIAGWAGLSPMGKGLGVSTKPFVKSNSKIALV